MTCFCKYPSFSSVTLVWKSNICKLSLQCYFDGCDGVRSNNGVNITSVFDFKLWLLFLKFIVLYLLWSGVLSYLIRDFMNWKSSFLPSHKEWLVHRILLSGRTLVAQTSLGIGVFFWPLKKLILASFCLMFLSCSCFSLDIYGPEKYCDSLLYVTMVAIAFVCLIPCWVFIVALKLPDTTCMKPFSVFNSCT